MPLSRRIHLVIASYDKSSISTHDIVSPIHNFVEMPIYIIVMAILNWILDPSYIVVCPIHVIFLPLDSICTVRNIISIFVGYRWADRFAIAICYDRKRWSSGWHPWLNHLLYFLSSCINYFSLLLSFNTRSDYFSFSYCRECLIYWNLLWWLYRTRPSNVRSHLLVNSYFLYLILDSKGRGKLLLLNYFIFIDLLRFNWNCDFFF